MGSRPRNSTAEFEPDRRLQIKVWKILIEEQKNKSAFTRNGTGGMNIFVANARVWTGTVHDCDATHAGTSGILARRCFLYEKGHVKNYLNRYDEPL